MQVYATLVLYSRPTLIKGSKSTATNNLLSILLLLEPVKCKQEVQEKDKLAL